ncbi:hypothetical protein ACTOJ1_000162 [Shigella flexneri]
MLKKWKITDYNYNFPPITNSKVFLNCVKDIATLLFSLYEDIPAQFYFYKESKYEIKFSENLNVLSVFKERQPELYYNFMDSINNDINVLDFMINQLFIDKHIFFKRKIINEKIISTSNFYHISDMIFIDNNLQNSFFYMNFNINNKTRYSIIKKKIEIVKNIIQHKPSDEKVVVVLDVIKSLNGRGTIFYFEDKFSFSWADLIILYGDSSWLNELKTVISKKSYLNNVNLLVLSIITDDVNILAFYDNNEQNFNTIINNPYETIKKINPNYINYNISDERDISLLSLSVLLNATNVFKYLISKVNIDYLSGKYKESAIFFACKNADFNFIQILVERGCDLTIENINGNIASELLPLSQDADVIFKYLEDKRKAS